MATPTLSTLSGATGTSTSASATLQSGTAPKLVIFCVDGNHTIATAASGWNVVNWKTTSNSASFAALWHPSTSDTSLAITWGGASETFAYVTGNAGGADWATRPPEFTTVQQGYPHDPPAITPTWGTAEMLVVAIAANDDGRRTANAAPTNYGNFLFQNVNAADGVATAAATRLVIASSEDPGTFGNNGGSVNAGAATMAYRGAADATEVVVNTAAASLGLRAAATTVDVGPVEVDTAAAQLGLRAAITSVDIAAVEVDALAARLAFRAAVTTVSVGAREVDTTAAAVAMRAAVTTVESGQIRVNTTAARLGLRAATTAVEVGAIEVDTMAARLALRAAVTDVDAGQTTVDTTAARLGLRAAVTSVAVGPRIISTTGARMGLRAAVTIVETPTTTVNTTAASMGFRAGTTTVDIGPVVVNTQAATLGLRAAVTTVDTPVLRIVNTAAAVLGIRAARTTVQAFIPPVPDDESLWGRMIQLLQCAIESLNAQAASDPTLKPAPDRAFVQPGGQVAWDNCCDCDGDSCGGQLWVRIVRAHPSGPYPVKSLAVVPCADDFATQIALGIVRCVHTMDDNGYPPTAEELTIEAHQAVCDMAALLRAIECCSDDIDQTVVVDQWLPVGASGGCAGGEWQAYTDAPIRCAPMILEPA